MFIHHVWVREIGQRDEEKKEGRGLQGCGPDCRPPPRCVHIQDVPSGRRRKRRERQEREYDEEDKIADEGVERIGRKIGIAGLRVRDVYLQRIDGDDRGEDSGAGLAEHELVPEAEASARRALASQDAADEEVG